MKKLLLLLSMTLICSVLTAQDTITGWTFPVNSGADSLNANLGTTQNQTYDMRFQWVTPNDTTVNTVFFTDGATDYAAATLGWENGANEKYWSIKFKAPGYEGIKVSSRQKGIYSTYAAGPRDFKIQWKISGGDYADVDGGVIQVANDWTTGAVSNLPVPITGQGSSSVYIRWISTSNLNINDEVITPNGISMIDDILVTGTGPSGTEDILFTNRLQMYPTPNNGKFTIASRFPVKSVDVYDINGKLVYSNLNMGFKFSVDLGKVAKGTYILKTGFTDTEQVFSVKFLVD